MWCLPVPGLRWRFTLACGLPPFQGLFAIRCSVTGVSLSLHPGLCSASPSGLLLARMLGGLFRWRIDPTYGSPCKHDCAHLHKILPSGRIGLELRHMRMGETLVVSAALSGLVRYSLFSHRGFAIATPRSVFCQPFGLAVGNNVRGAVSLDD